MENIVRPEETTSTVTPHVHFPLPAQHVFGGFWIRFAAMTIDYACIVLPCALLFGVILLLVGLRVNDSVVAIVTLLLMLVAAVWSFGYFIALYGTKSTTLGKMLFGMRVVREDNGGKLSWGQAFGRTFSYILSRIFYIGFIIAAFDDEKRALHDRLAKTRVIRDTRKLVKAGWVVFGVIMAVWVVGVTVAIAAGPVRTLLQGGYDDYDYDYYEDLYDTYDADTYDSGAIVSDADYEEGYRAGYTDGRGEYGEFGDSYLEPATESRRADYEVGYVEGFLAGCADGNFDCSEISEMYYNTDSSADATY